MLMSNGNHLKTNKHPLKNFDGITATVIKLTYFVIWYR
jgi:hypothetical protein